MRKSLIYFADYRAMLNNKNILVVHAGTNEVYMENAKVTATMDGREIPVKSVVCDNNRTHFCYRSENLLFSCEYQFMMDVTDDFGKIILKVEFPEKYDYTAVFTILGRRFRKSLKLIKCCVDSVKVRNDDVQIKGWCTDGEPISIGVFNGSIQAQATVNRMLGKDIAESYQEGELVEPAGFEVLIAKSGIRKAKVIFSTPHKQLVKKIDLTKDQSHEKYFIGQALELASDYIRRRGFKAFIVKCFKKLFRINSFDYDSWIKNHEPDKKDLKKQEEKVFDKKPLFSIIVPVYRPKAKFFTEMIKSVMAQTYGNWELCLADGSGEGFYMDKVASKAANGDTRVKYIKLDSNKGISGNTNAALEAATGDYIVLGDHDDLFRPDALYECACVINNFDKVDIIYTDEDKFDMGQRKRIYPHFKPDFNLDMLRNNNYICHMFVFARHMYEDCGGFRSEFDGSQDYDLILRYTEKAEVIKHIPKVLYSWRCHENSTAMNPDSKGYAFVAGKKAVEAHLERCNIKAEVSFGKNPGHYDIDYPVIGNPMISIIIPNKDHIEDLDVCLNSISTQDFNNYEILIVENNSEKQETFDYYKRIEADYAKIHIIYWKDKFNYSGINNYGAKHAKGDYLLLLNNDTEMIRTDCLRKLISFGTRPEVGIVGARLLYPDDTVQHAGVVIGIGGVAAHAFTGIKRDDRGYFDRAVIPQDYCAVTAACLLVRKTVFDKVGGLEESLEVAFNDVDFCLKVVTEGYLVVYNPAAELYHYESKSRGYEDTPEKVERFENEANYMVTKWKRFIDEGDPCYNVNLTLGQSDFSPKE